MLHFVSEQHKPAKLDAVSLQGIHLPGSDAIRNLRYMFTKMAVKQKIQNGYRILLRKLSYIITSIS